ncbi:hypothetical protein [Spirosoma montaniterrae]|uniref:3-keto-disaccharide hydrolase domain-containing protein n=1 Tax=Spirosoma montaniterrae TaxID=1178516 RepID=A0A1P9WSI0_9BACT|nr:hypothetical protein [Spirosoma montaniterrae]AQG78310.1 hypothetical protein AWR27_02510 [Spirosoma montaniterrae]
MRSTLFILFCGLAISAFGQSSARRQPKPTLYSASSEWQKVVFKATPLRSSDQPTVATNTPAPVSPKPQPPATEPAPVADITGPKNKEAATTKPVAKTAEAVAAKPTSKSSTEETVTTKAPAKKTAALTFTDNFTNNKHRWLQGKRKGYEFEIARSSFYIRRTAEAIQSVGRCYVDLPASMDLNKAQSFTISVEMSSPPGESPEGGLLLGVQDVDNLTQFMLAGQKEVIIKSTRDGSTFAAYMPGKKTPIGFPAKMDRNVLTVIKEQEKLHFYLNDQEIETSPYDFRKFRGNGVGFIAGQTAVKFQNLQVTVAE